MMSSRPRDPAGADEGISQLKQCIQLVRGLVCRGSRDVFINTICGLFGLLAERTNDPLCLYALSKLLLEACIQTAYYRLQGLSAEEAYERVKRRSKGAASFSATMIRRLPGVHGSRKKWLMRIYLRLGEYTHPTPRIYGGGIQQVDQELVVSIVDACYYLLLVAGLARDDMHVASECGLEKSLRLLRRRHEV